MTDVKTHPHSSFADGQKAAARVAMSTTTGIRAAQKPAPLHSVELALSRSEDLSARVIALADRLIGAIPEATGEGGQDMPAGIIPQLARKADYAGDAIAKAFAALDRLEGQL